MLTNAPVRCPPPPRQSAGHLGDLAGSKAVLLTASDPARCCGKPEGGHGSTILSIVCSQELVTLSQSLMMEASTLDSPGFLICRFEVVIMK